MNNNHNLEPRSQFVVAPDSLTVMFLELKKVPIWPKMADEA